MSSATASPFQPILLSLPSLTPSLAIEILPHGLTFHRIFVQADGKTHDIVIGPEDPTGHTTQKYTNTIIGRYANRLPCGSFALNRKGIHSVVSPPSNETATVCLHGGVNGFDQYAWEPLPDPSEAKLFTPAELSTIQTRVPASVLFRRISEDGEEGFPGKLLIEVLVGLVQPESANEGKEFNLGSIIVTYRAKLLEDKKVTPINLTQHWGFNLDASLQDGQAELSVKDHKIDIKADHTIELNFEGLSTGNLVPVSGTHHAHAEKSSGKIGESFPERGYDEFYVFSQGAPAPVSSILPESDLTDELDLVGAALARDGPAAQEVVSIAGAKSGLRIGFVTNQPGVQFYTNNYSLPDKTARKKIHGGSGEKGDGYGPGTAAFLEFHQPLASWIHPKTRTAPEEDSLLASGEVYHHFVRLDVWYNAPNGL